MSAKLQKAIVAKKRVCPSEKRAMVRLLVDEMKQYDPNPCTEHAKVVSSYPETFEDRTDEGECRGNGYY